MPCLTNSLSISHVGLNLFFKKKKKRKKKRSCIDSYLNSCTVHCPHCNIVNMCLPACSSSAIVRVGFV